MVAIGSAFESPSSYMFRKVYPSVAKSDARACDQPQLVEALRGDVDNHLAKRDLIRDHQGTLAHLRVTLECQINVGSKACGEVRIRSLTRSFHWQGPFLISVGGGLGQG